MTHPRAHSIVLSALLTLAPLAALADVVLAKLAPATPGAEAVEIRAGLDITASPLAGKAHTTWLLAPGEALARDHRPADRMIELYTGSTHNPTLLCRIWVRYYPNDARWVPEFQLIEEPVVASTARGWRPLILPQGTPLLIGQTGNTLPNAEGFKRSLEFGLVSGSMSIDAWRVR